MYAKRTHPEEPTDRKCNDTYIDVTLRFLSVGRQDAHARSVGFHNASTHLPYVELRGHPGSSLWAVRPSHLSEISNLVDDRRAHAAADGERAESLREQLVLSWYCYSWYEPDRHALGR